MFDLFLASINVVQNEQIEADVEQLMDLMKTRKQQLESLLDEKMKDFRLICVLENVRYNSLKLSCIAVLFIFSKSLVQHPMIILISMIVVFNRN